MRLERLAGAAWLRHGRVQAGLGPLRLSLTRCLIDECGCQHSVGAQCMAGRQEEEAEGPRKSLAFLRGARPLLGCLVLVQVPIL